MIIKLTEAGKNSVIYVNFDFVHTMSSAGAFTELVMSDDKYHKIVVAEKPEEIYEMLYPKKSEVHECKCHCGEAERKTSVNEEPVAVENTATAKKVTAKKAATKTVEEN